MAEVASGTDGIPLGTAGPPSGTLAAAGTGVPGRARPVARAAELLDDAGMATAEYAVATLAAVGFAGLLFAVLRSGEVQGMLTELVRRALSTV